MRILNKLNIVLTHFILWIIYIIYLWGLWGGYSIYKNQKIKNNIFLAVMSLLIIPFVWNLISSNKKQIIKFLKSNLLVWIYLILRIIMLRFHTGDTSIMPTICIEALFFILMNGLLFKNIKSIDGLVGSFLVITFVCNLLTVFLSLNMDVQEILKYPKIYEMIMANGENLNTIIIRNTNFLGIITGFSLVLSLAYMKKEKVWFWVYLLSGFYFLWFSNCRGAEVATIVCFIAYGSVKIIPKFKEKYIAYSTLAFSIFFSILICCFIFSNTNGKQELFEYTKSEQKVQKYTTGRYSIWKTDINATKPYWIFGTGSFERQKDNRQKYLQEHTGESLNEQSIAASIKYLNAHNGYIGLFVVTGVTGLVLFLLIIFQKIHQMDELSSQKWSLALSYFFIINLFEDYFLRTPVFLFVGIFFMMLFLGMGNKAQLD